MESGATAWEVRELAKQYDGKDRVTNRPAICGVLRDAIVHEALECLAAKKEAERIAREGLGR